MSIINYGCYDFNDNVLLIELELTVSTDSIRWSEIAAPIEGVPADNWQVPYMEQYLSSDGTEKICETYTEPSPAAAPCRVAFFIYKTEEWYGRNAEILRTPYGNISLNQPQPLPERLAEIIEFEDVD